MANYLGLYHGVAQPLQGALQTAGGYMERAGERRTRDGDQLRDEWERRSQQELDNLRSMANQNGMDMNDFIRTEAFDPSMLEFTTRLMTADNKALTSRQLVDAKQGLSFQRLDDGTYAQTVTRKDGRPGVITRGGTDRDDDPAEVLTREQLVNEFYAPMLSGRMSMFDQSNFNAATNGGVEAEQSTFSTQQGNRGSVPRSQGLGAQPRVVSSSADVRGVATDGIGTVPEQLVAPEQPMTQEPRSSADIRSVGDPLGGRLPGEAPEQTRPMTQEPRSSADIRSVGDPLGGRLPGEAPEQTRPMTQEPRSSADIRSVGDPLGGRLPGEAPEQTRPQVPTPVPESNEPDTRSRRQRHLDRRGLQAAARAAGNVWVPPSRGAVADMTPSERREWGEQLATVARPSEDMAHDLDPMSAPIDRAAGRIAQTGVIPEGVDHVTIGGAPVPTRTIVNFPEEMAGNNQYTLAQQAIGAALFYKSMTGSVPEGLIDEYRKRAFGPSPAEKLDLLRKAAEYDKVVYQISAQQYQLELSAAQLQQSVVESNHRMSMAEMQFAYKLQQDAVAQLQERQTAMIDDQLYAYMVDMGLDRRGDEKMSRNDAVAYGRGRLQTTAAANPILQRFLVEDPKTGQLAPTNGVAGLAAMRMALFRTQPGYQPGDVDLGKLPATAYAGVLSDIDMANIMEGQFYYDRFISSASNDRQRTQRNDRINRLLNVEVAEAVKGKPLPQGMTPEEAAYIELFTNWDYYVK